MKKSILILMAGVFGLAVQAQVCNPNPPDPNATEVGANPNPLETAYSFVSYDHQNTILLPGKLDNTLTPQPGDSVFLCNLRILKVAIDTNLSFNQDVPSGFSYAYEVWQGANQIVDSNDVIDVNFQVQRICLRMKVQNPPMPVNNFCDSIYFQVVVRASIDLDGPGTTFTCQALPGNATVDTLYLTLPLCDSITMSLEDYIPNGFHITGTYPNPASDYTQLSFNLPSSGEVELILTDAMGKIVATEQFAGVNGKNVRNIPTQHLASGIYHYSLQYNGKKVSSKFVVAK